MFAESASEKIQVIAESVLKLSDYYIENPMGATPWDQKFCQIAYRNYYLPLNRIRVQHVIERGLKLGFFTGLKNFIDWGAGPGTASLALAANPQLSPQIEKQYLYDISESVLKNFSDLHATLKFPQKSTSLNLEKLPGHKESCLTFSYSLTEVNDLPYGWEKFEALMILEPSTSEDGRKLMQLREKLISAGFHIWAPCTHHMKCPLLIHSKHDWCHDRAHVVAPDWFDELEHYLPMRNRTVTTSYLLARKTAPRAHLKDLARLTGDSMVEKGKTRQLICRNENREFLTWMHKSISPETIARGELIEMPKDFEPKANELRVKSKIQISTPF